jgi:hypothetical protein
VLYLVLNLLCHVVHSALILFVLLGWMFAPLQAAHLAIVLGMLGWTLNPARLDRSVGVAAVGIALLSAAVNLPHMIGWLS